MIMSAIAISTLGANGIVTDEPKVARDRAVERSGLNSVERSLIHTAVLFDQPVPLPVYRCNSPGVFG